MFSKDKINKVLILFMITIMALFGEVFYNGKYYQEVNMPFTNTGDISNYFVVAGNITQVYSDMVNSLLINGVDYSNQTVTTFPEPINGMYFFDYVPRNWKGRLDIFGTTNWMDTVKVDTIVINGSYSFSGRAKQLLIIDTTLNYIYSNNVDSFIIDGINKKKSRNYKLSTRHNLL